MNDIYDISQEESKKDNMYRLVQSQLSKSSVNNDHTNIMKAFLALILEKEREIIRLKRLIREKDQVIEKMGEIPQEEDVTIAPLNFRNNTSVKTGYAADYLSNKDSLNANRYIRNDNSTVILKGDASIEEQIDYFDGKFFQGNCTANENIIESVNNSYYETSNIGETSVEFSFGEIDATSIMLKTGRKEGKEEIGNNIRNTTREIRLVQKYKKKLEQNDNDNCADKERISSFQEKRNSIETQLKEIQSANKRPNERTDKIRQKDGKEDEGEDDDNEETEEDDEYEELEEDYEYEELEEQRMIEDEIILKDYRDRRLIGRINFQEEFQQEESSSS